MELQLTDSERIALRALQRQHRDGPGYVKVTVVLLLDKGRSVPQIADDLGLDPATVYRYAAAYQAQGLASYVAPAPETGGYWGLLTSAQLGRLCRQLDEHLYTDCRPIRDWIKATFGVTYSISGLTDLLHRLGYTYKLTMAVPCQANAAVQEAFLADTLLPLLAQAEAGTAVVYFADAAHPTHNTRATHCWTQVGQERPLATVSGRERVNLNAALNAVVPTQILLDETDCVNAQSTQRLYKKLLAAHPEGPIYVVCDNARYYKNKDLAAWLVGQRLVPIFLPTYSPNLNLIERFWKFLRQKVINTCFYRTKGAFKTAVLAFFNRIEEFGPQLASLLTRNFHILDAQPAS
jgi:transposase